ncbi:MAG: hypothetical protein AMK71_10490 [Nitrospira bacterium SG8_35_4]|nr:MAG: hypothetical protein AMK71_10490 [Nitrospira bacterium SG8_35_4]
MKIKKEYAILFFIIVVLVYYISSERSDRTHYQLPEVRKIQQADITKINIRKKDADIVLIRNGDGWRVGPERYPASDAGVRNIINTITALKLTALVSESKNYPLYELDEEQGIEVEAFRGDESLLRVRVGKPASSYRHTFVLLGDDYRVYHADGNLNNEFNKTVPDLRDKKVMSFSDEIIKITLKKGKDEFTIIKETPPVSADVTGKEGKGEPEQPAKWIIPGGKPVKQNDVDGIVTTLSNLDCDDFIEGKRREDYTSPVYTITLKGADTYSLSFFEKKDNQYPAVSSQSDYPFLLSEWKAGRIMKDQNSLTEVE